MIRLEYSKLLSPADRLVYRDWLRRIVAFYAACAFIVGALAATMYTEIAPSEASRTSSGSHDTPLALKVVSAP